MSFATALIVIAMTLATSARAADKVLVVVSAASSMMLKEGKIHPTGYFLGELVEPLEAIAAAGFDYDIATPGGMAPTIDKNGNRLFYWSFDFKARERAMNFVQKSEKLRAPLNLDSLTEQALDSYAGVFVPGGHGPMVDLVANPSMAMVLEHFHRNQKPTGLLCHGPAVLLSLTNHSWPYAGYRMTVVSNLEEIVAEKVFLRGSVPFEYPEDSLRDAGALVETNKLVVHPKVVWDRELITGQNPYASKEFGRVFVEALSRQKQHAL